MHNPLKQIAYSFVLLLLLAGCQSEPAASHPGDGQDSLPSQPGVQVAPAAGETFSQRFERFVTTVFEPDYKRRKMDPMDRFPQFKEAPQSTFVRLQKAQPISNSAGRSVYPRLLVKGYRFPDQKLARSATYDWLAEMEHRPDTIRLGQDVDYIKSPPQFGAISNGELYLVQTACIYQHASYDAVREAFIDFWEKANAAYIFEIECEGRLHYHFAPF